MQRPLYFHHLHDNANSDSHQRAEVDADQVRRDFLAAVLAEGTPCANPLAPQARANHALLVQQAFALGKGALVPIPVQRSVAEEQRTAPRRVPTTPPANQGASGPGKTALVVLGMHRSGTSALSRVLNLCGAFLPAKLTPPNRKSNPTGFWESEDVIYLNERTLNQMGAAWNQVEFSLPSKGEFVDEFVSDACTLLANEYRDEQTILIKDPRVCVLAPLWHQALITGGYRPVYVVPVRNPLEVAQSLHARGDMSVRDGLALWFTYMARVASFTESCPAVVHVCFTELLADWRRVVARIANRFDLPLDLDARAEEVDRFLESGMRRQSSSEEALDALPADPAIEEIRALYRTYVARSDCDARSGPPAATPIAAECEARTEGPDEAPSTTSFVLCIENNAIRDQALLLCASIRRFGGRYRRAPILAFAPRPGLGVDVATRRALTAMNVQYVDEPLNTYCPEYGSANRVFAAAWAEAQCDSEFIVVLDSDTVFLDEPELPREADVAVRPVDSKGSATRGPGDPFEDYWTKLAAIGGTSIERLPYLYTTISGERIRASYNGGLIVARREKGILTRWADLFAASVSAGIRPYRGSGMNIFASTGHVGQGASEYWGSNQAALALAIWATTDRVLTYPDHYNVPLHYLTTNGDIDRRWLARPPVHLHYHWMFGQHHHEVALELLAMLGVPADQMAWLLHRIPFRDIASNAVAPSPAG